MYHCRVCSAHFKHCLSSLIFNIELNTCFAMLKCLQMKGIFPHSSPLWLGNSVQGQSWRWRRLNSPLGCYLLSPPFISTANMKKDGNKAFLSGCNKFPSFKWGISGKTGWYHRISNVSRVSKGCWQVAVTQQHKWKTFYNFEAKTITLIMQC